jgi:hypothetical protein
MELEDDLFFEFVKHYADEKVAILLEFQDLTNVECLLACTDPLEILSFDSDDLLDLKKKMCVKLNNNTFVVLPGIKNKMNLLKNSLMKIANQFKKNSKSSTNVITPNNTSTVTLATNNYLNPSNESNPTTANNSSLHKEN